MSSSLAPPTAAAASSSGKRKVRSCDQCNKETTIFCSTCGDDLCAGHDQSAHSDAAAEHSHSRVARQSRRLDSDADGEHNTQAEEAPLDCEAEMQYITRNIVQLEASLELEKRAFTRQQPQRLNDIASRHRSRGAHSFTHPLWVALHFVSIASLVQLRAQRWRMWRPRPQRSRDWPKRSSR